MPLIILKWKNLLQKVHRIYAEFTKMVCRIFILLGTEFWKPYATSLVTGASLLLVRKWQSAISLGQDIGYGQFKCQLKTFLFWINWPCRIVTVCSLCLGNIRTYLSLCIWCLSEGKRGDYQNCFVLYCVLKLCTVISTLRWAVLTVLWIGFCHTGPISPCVDSFVFICVYFVNCIHVC